MTGSDKEGYGGPSTAAYQKIDGNYVNLVIKTDKETHIHQSEDVEDYKNWDELVRREDVKSLIQCKIKIIREMEVKQSNSLKLQGYREARRKLEELLEELEK